MRISDWSSDVCSSDLLSSFDEERDIIFPGSEHLAGRLWPCRKGVHRRPRKGQGRPASVQARQLRAGGRDGDRATAHCGGAGCTRGGAVRAQRCRRPSQGSTRRLYAVLERTEQESGAARSEEHTSELQSLMRSSYAVFCLKKKTH